MCAVLRQVAESGVARDGVEVPGPGDPDFAPHLVASFAPRGDPDGTVVGVGCVMQDVTDQHVAAPAAQLSGDPRPADRPAQPGPVHGPPPGGAQQARPQRPGAVAVLFFDLDHFKTVNDSLGHKWGDRLLRTVAIRLEGVVRPGDTVARLGGDEFAMLCEGFSGPDDAMNIGRRMVAATAEPVSDESHTVEVTASVGIALARGPAVDRGH